MIRLTILTFLVLGLMGYAFKDWFKSLCGLIILMAVIEHPDMPKSLLGIQGLNLWNILLLIVLIAWATNRRQEGLIWDMPRYINWLLFFYLSIIVLAFLRMIGDQSELVRYARLTETDSPGTGSLISEHLINSIKWVIPGLLVFDGCRDRSRINLALFSTLGIYFLLAVQVIKWMPLSSVVSGDSLKVRSLKILLNEIGYHRVNLSMMLSGAFWAIFSTKSLVTEKKYVRLIIAASFIVFLGQALTGGRTGYATWIVIGLILSLLKWRKYLFLLPVLIMLIVMFVPGVAERMMQGFTPETRNYSTRFEQTYSSDGDSPDLYTITAGRNLAWPYILEKIKDSPWIGYGFSAMQRTGISAYLFQNFGEIFPHPHNAYLQLLLDAGVIGFVPIIIFYMTILKYSMSLFRDSSNSLFVAVGGVTLSLVTALLVASVGSQTFYPREGAVGMWCAIGLMLRVYVDRQRTLQVSNKMDIR